MQKSLREVLSLKGCDLIFEYKGNVIAIDTKEFTAEKEEAVYQKFGLKTLRGNEWVTLYNPEVWEAVGTCGLTLVEDCLAPEQPFFIKAPMLVLEGVKNLSHWDVASAKNLSLMFYKCESLESLLLNGWDVSSVKDMPWMFGWCKSLESLSLDGWNVSGVKDVEGMFYNCKSLKSLSLGGWCISKEANTNWMFDDCPAGISVESLVERTTPCSVF